MIAARPEARIPPNIHYKIWFYSLETMCPLFVTYIFVYSKDPYTIRQFFAGYGVILFCNSVIFLARTLMTHGFVPLSYFLMLLWSTNCSVPIFMATVSSTFVKGFIFYLYALESILFTVYYVSYKKLISAPSDIVTRPSHVVSHPSMVVRIIVETVEANDGHCSICLESYESGRVVKLPCNHVYHNDCIQEWSNRGNTTCPICRSPNCARIKWVHK